MSSNLVTARECIKAFEDIGVTMSEPSFSKYKKRGVFKTYSVEGKKRDMFNLEEVLTTFFEVNLPTNKSEQKRRDQYYIERNEREERKKVLDNISIEWGKLEGYEELTVEMFNIKDLWINAADKLRELKENEIKGETIIDIKKDHIIWNASKTKEDHIEEFKREIYTDNQINFSMLNFMDRLFDDFEEKYSNFRESSGLLDILKSVNNHIITPENIAERFAVDLVDSEK